MVCKEAQECFFAYFEKELPAKQEAEFLEHLHSCTTCQILFEEYRRCLGNKARPLEEMPRCGEKGEKQRARLLAYGATLAAVLLFGLVMLLRNG